MRRWCTSCPCELRKKSHTNVAVYDSTGEATESFALDYSDHVDAWVKNDHLGFEVLNVYRGVVKKYRPDFLIRLRSGSLLVLEVKGVDSDENLAKRDFLAEWVTAVNCQSGFAALVNGTPPAPTISASAPNSRSGCLHHASAHIPASGWPTSAAVPKALRMVAICQSAK